MILDWLKNPFRQEADDSLQRRAEQSQVNVNIDEDSTDETHKKFNKGYRDLTFTLDAVIRDLTKNGHR